MAGMQSAIRLHKAENQPGFVGQRMDGLNFRGVPSLNQMEKGHAQITYNTRSCIRARSPAFEAGRDLLTAGKRAR
jgi:hypothetical protein